MKGAGYWNDLHMEKPVKTVNWGTIGILLINSNSNIIMTSYIVWFFVKVRLREKMKTGLLGESYGYRIEANFYRETT